MHFEHYGLFGLSLNLLAIFNLRTNVPSNSTIVRFSQFCYLSRISSYYCYTYSYFFASYELSILLFSIFLVCEVVFGLPIVLTD